MRKPTTNHVSSADKANLTALLAQFRAQLDALGAGTGKHYLLIWEMSGTPGR
jgi:chitinase